jgi:hypothetical protein
MYRSSSIVAALGVMLSALCVPSRAGAAPRETGAAATSGVPLPLRESQEQAIRIFDAARAEQWGLADRTVQHLAATVPRINGDVDDLEARTTALRKSIAVKDKLATMTVANDLTMLTADLADPYSPQVPTDVDRLEAYGRAALIASETADVAKLRELAGEVQKVWTRLHQAALARGDIDDVRALDKAVNELAHASHVNEYRQGFTHQRNALEGIRKSFSR